MKKLKNLNFSFFKPILVYFSIFYLPFQTSKYFFLPQSYILGVKRDFLAPAIYFKYLIIFLAILVFIKEVKGVIYKSKKKIILFYIFLFVNLIFSQNKPITLYKIFQISLLLLFTTLLLQLKRKKKIKGEIVLIMLLIGAIIEFFLVFYQILKGASFQGFFYFLGERKIDLFSPAVAKAVFFGRIVLRGYGTFSHPNSLAGFYVFLYFLSFKEFFKKTSFWLVILFRSICAFLILLSFSKAAILAFLIGDLIIIFRNKGCVFCKFSQSLAFFSTSSLFLFTGFRKESLTERIEQLYQAKEVFLSHFLFGTGFGAYLTAISKEFSYLPSFLIKNLHNAIFLFFIESGIVFIPIVIFLLKGVSLRRFIKENWLIVFVVVFTSFFDHYWWTLPQNLFVLSLIVF